MRAVKEPEAPIRFERASLAHQQDIFRWLDSPHVKEFWDNSPEHREDLLIFMKGRAVSSLYFGGVFTYWVGSMQEQPYCLIMTSEITSFQELPPLWEKHLSQTGRTYSLDLCIGNKMFLGQGLAAPTLEAFTKFFQNSVDPSADTFFIDPDKNNPRASHVYGKAGFKPVGEYVMELGFFAGHSAQLMVKKMAPLPPLRLEKGKLSDYPIVQNMARFYVYDMSRYCGELPGWECPEDGLYESFDYKHYFEEERRQAFLIRHGQELVGFVLVEQKETLPPTIWNMGEFFILAKFQGKGIGQQVVRQVWQMLPGAWEVAVMPKNHRALNFWKKVISEYTQDHFLQEKKSVDYDPDEPFRIIFSFQASPYI